MKHFSLFAIACGLAPFASAQLIEVADQRNTDVFYGKIVPIGTHWVAAAQEGPVNNGSYPGHFTTAIDVAGEESWAFVTPMSLTTVQFIGVAGELAASPHGGVYLIGPEDYCDIFGDQRLIQLDTNGTVLMDRTYQHPDIYQVERIARSPVDHLALLGINGAIITDLSGEPTDSWLYPFPENWWFPTLATWATDSTLLLTNGEYLVRTDIMGAPLDTLQFSEDIQDMIKYDDDVLILTATELHQVSFDGVLLSTSPYTAPPGYRAFAPGSSTGYFQSDNVLYRWQEGIGIVEVLAPELLPGQVITGMSVSDDRLMTVSTMTQYGMATGVIRSFDLEGNTTSHDLDIAVDQVEIDSTWVTQLTSNPMYYRFFANVTVTLTNSGSEPIGSVVLSHRTSIPVELCGLPATRIELDPISLQPGASMTVAIDSLELMVTYLSSTSPDVNRDVCIVAQSPNKLMDRVPANNSACDTFGFVVGLEELTSGKEIKVFPNPFSTSFAIQGPFNGPLQLELFDAQGRSVFSQFLLDGGTLRTAVPNDLDPGMYLLRMTDNDRRWTKQVVKE